MQAVLNIYDAHAYLFWTRIADLYYGDFSHADREYRDFETLVFDQYQSRQSTRDLSISQRNVMEITSILNP